MKIIDIFNFYYSLYPVLAVTVQMYGGIDGKPHVVNKAQALEWLNGWLDETAISVSFQTHCYTYGNTWGREWSKTKCEIPMLYILYSAED